MVYGKEILICRNQKSLEERMLCVSQSVWKGLKEVEAQNVWALRRPALDQAKNVAREDQAS